LTRVVILQEYVPQYRSPFFQALHERASPLGIDIVVACGNPRKAQRLRGDAVALSFLTTIKQREWKILGRRVVIRDVGAVISGADLIILEQARRNVDAYRLLIPRRKTERIVALWGHGRDYTHKVGRVDLLLQRWLTLRAGWFFAYTAGGATAVREAGFPRSKITVVQNSIDTHELRHAVDAVTVESIDAFRSDLDLHGMTATFVGALDESKRLAFLIDSGNRAHQLLPAFRLLIAGDGPLRSQVEAWAEQHAWLTFLGSVTGSQKAEVLAGSQILAMPGRVGLVAVDSFAAQLPIVTTDWKWHAPEFEYLTDGVTAVISEDTVESFARAMCDTLSDPGKLKRLREACGLASDSTTIDVMADNFLAGIQAALKNKESRPLGAT
jgi:glycosyltransferase involved in cell wall biosynthesis